MTDREEPEQQQADLLWTYIEQLKQADNPDTVQFVAVTNGWAGGPQRPRGPATTTPSGRCPFAPPPTEGGCGPVPGAEGAVAEVVGLMETAAVAGAWARTESAPGCRREMARRRLRGVIAAALPAAPSPASAVGTARAAGPEPAPLSPLRAWVNAPITVRSAGWVVAVGALAVLFWMASPRAPTAEISPPPVPPATHEQALRLMPSLVDGTLDAADSLAVWEHLNRCRACLRTYQAQWHTAHPDHPAHQSHLWVQPPLDRWRQLPLSAAVRDDAACDEGQPRPVSQPVHGGCSTPTPDPGSAGVPPAWADAGVPPALPGRRQPWADIRRAALVSAAVAR